VAYSPGYLLLVIASSNQLDYVNSTDFQLANMKDPEKKSKSLF